MTTPDALRAMGAAALVLCLGFPEAAPAESQRGKPNFEKQSMTRSGAAPTGRSAKPALGAVETARSAPGPTTRSSSGAVAKALPTRFKVQTARRPSDQTSATQPVSRSSEPFAGRTPGEIPTQGSARTKGPVEPRSSRTAESPPAARTADPIDTRGPRREGAKQAMVRSTEPAFRAPVPDANPTLTARTKPEAPSVRSAHAPAKHLSVRATRGTWLDWLFGR